MKLVEGVGRVLLDVARRVLRAIDTVAVRLAPVSYALGMGLEAQWARYVAIIAWALLLGSLQWLPTTLSSEIEQIEIIAGFEVFPAWLVIFSAATALLMVGAIASKWYTNSKLEKVYAEARNPLAEIGFDEELPRVEDMKDELLLAVVVFIAIAGTLFLRLNSSIDDDVWSLLDGKPLIEAALVAGWSILQAIPLLGTIADIFLSEPSLPDHDATPAIVLGFRFIMEFAFVAILIEVFENALTQELTDKAKLARLGKQAPNVWARVIGKTLPGAISGLPTALRADSPDWEGKAKEHLNALAGLGQAGIAHVAADEVTNAVARALDAPSLDVQTAAAEAAGRLQLPGLLDALVQALAKIPAGVPRIYKLRRAIIQSLGLFTSSRKALDAILSQVDDASNYVRSDVAFVLSNFGPLVHESDPETSRALKAKIRETLKRYQKDASPLVRSQAEASLRSSFLR